VSVSASQTDKARSCWRRWAFDAFDPIPNESPELQAAAEGGSALHKVAENYHMHGRAPDPSTLEGRAFKAALPFVPPPRTGKAEGEFTMTVSGVEYGGFVDLELEDHRGLYPLREQAEGLSALPGVLDYKSKGEIRRGERTNIIEGDAAFYDNPQTLIYATRALVKYRQAPAVYMRWLYIKRLDKITQQPKVFPSDAIMDRARTVAAFGRIVHPIAKTITHLRQHPIDPLTLPPNPATCMRYGSKYACQYMARCNLSPGDVLRGADSNQTTEDISMGLLDDLKAKQTATATAVPATAKTPDKAEAPTSALSAAPASAEGAAPKGINPPKREAVLTPAPTSAPVSIENASDAELGRALRVLLKAYKGA
jgi:hypothetical protein